VPKELHEIKERYEELRKTCGRTITIMDAWLYGLSKWAGESEGADFRALQSIQSEAVHYWLHDLLHLELKKAKTPFDACRKYLALMDKNGLMLKANFRFKKKGEKLIFTIRNPCIYGNICAAIVDEGAEPLCLRSEPFVVAIKEMAKKQYKTEAVDVEPTSRCIIEFWPVK
jgi:hypothetical protein